ncbi:hypothetical protein K502DRAFT_361855 [Neoconidiobolus thromboides FSU 785]|nr:hypothetical protein K502DRAFT_361855 [Neoconidiobolus thromboides FSU 785]
MPVSYIVNRESKKKINYSEEILDLYHGLISLILKNRVSKVPTQDSIKEEFESVLRQNGIKTKFNVYLVINLKDANGNKTPVEIWYLNYDKLNTGNSKSISEQKHFRSSEAALYYKSVYYFIKGMPISKKIFKSNYIKDQLNYELKFNNDIILPFKNIKHEFTNLISKKRHLVQLEVNHENEYEKIDTSKFTIKPAVSPPINIPTAKENKCKFRPSSPIPDFTSFTPSPAGFSFINRAKKSSCSEALVGSYEQSLLSGRMSSFPSKPINGFTAKIGASFRNNITPHVTFPFSPTFYQHDEETSSPYVGDINLGEDFQDRLQIPKEGKLQIILKNSCSTAIHLFLVPYDFKDIPNCHKTFLRHKTYVSKVRHPNILRHAIHLQFASDSEGKLYLYKNIRVVFTLRAVESFESTFCSFDLPPSPIKYSHLSLYNQRVPDTSKEILAVAATEDAYLGYQ